MPDIKHIGIILSIVLLISSCTGSQSIISIEVLEPAAITYPDEVQKVGYLNRSPRSVHSFSRINVDSLSPQELFMVDTIICEAIRRGFIEGKKDAHTGYLDDLYYLEARRNDTLYRDSIVSHEKVLVICESFGLDALITQDYYAFKFNQTYVWMEGAVKPLKILIQEARWTLSVPGQVKPLDTYTVYDTLYYGNQGDKGSPKFLTPLEMLSDGAHVLGYIYGKRNVPKWNQLSRTVFVGGHKELKQASKYTDKGEWEKAHHLWSQYLDSEDKKLAAKSAHNIAVYYELEDEIEQALAFSGKALELWSTPPIETYKQELELRLLNKKDVYKQLRINESMSQ